MNLALGIFPSDWQNAGHIKGIYMFLIELYEILFVLIKVYYLKVM
jgi:hypothetical protein